MLKLLPFVVLLVSCSQFPSSRWDRKYEVQRSLASTPNTASCSSLLSDLSMRERTFSVTQFDQSFQEVGSGYVVSVLDETIRAGQLTREQTELVGDLAQRLRGQASTADALRELSVDDKYLVWNVVIRPQMTEIEEVVLQTLADDGDEAAAFLLRVPAGEMRDNARSAVSLLRKAEPESSISDIVRRLEQRMSVCVR